MKTKLFLEPKGKVREEVILHSAIPDSLHLFTKWKESWISKKEFKNWLKQDWFVDELGELRSGKIINVGSLESNQGKIKGKLYAFRSFFQESTGEKKKLPIVLFGKLKSNFKLDYWVSEFNLSKDEKDTLKKEMKSDPWAPLSIWHAAPLKRNEEIPNEELVLDAIQYMKALFSHDFKSYSFQSFVETEIFRS